MEESISLAQVCRMPGKEGIRCAQAVVPNSSRNKPQRLSRREAEPGPAPPHVQRLHSKPLSFQDSIPETNILMQKNMVIYR